MPTQAIWPTARIAVIDDEPANLRLVQTLLEGAGYSNIAIFEDPAAALQALSAKPFDLIILDLHMPRLSGYDVLTYVRNEVADAAALPILVSTADTSAEARRKALELGAADFLTKPCDTLELLLRVRNFLRARATHLTVVNANAKLEASIARRTRELTSALRDALECLKEASKDGDQPAGRYAKTIWEISATLAANISANERAGIGGRD